MTKRLRLHSFVLLVLCFSLFVKTTHATTTMWYDNGTDIFTLSSKVGVGTSIPSQKLEVVGNLYQSSSSNWLASAGKLYLGAGLAGSGYNGPGGKFYGSAELNFSSSAGTKMNFLDGYNKYFTVDSSNVNLANFESGAANTITTMTIDTGSNSRFRVNNESGSELFSVKGSNGYVGIGTTNPLQKLDLRGSLYITGAIYASGASGTSGQILSSTGSGVQWVNVPSGVGATYLAGNGLTLVGNTFNLGGALNQNTSMSLQNYHTFNISTSDTPNAFYVNPNGHVGIGTSGANNRLAVAGDGDVSSGSHSVASFTQSLTNGIYLGYKSDGSTVTSAQITADNQLPITFGSSSGIDSMTVTNQGMVEVNGGVKLAPVSGQVVKPGCTSAARGTMWFTAGVGVSGPSAKDKVEVCAQDTLGISAWRTLY